METILICEFLDRDSCGVRELVHEGMKAKWILNRDAVLEGKRVRKGLSPSVP